MRFGEYLNEKNILTKDALLEGLETQRYRPKRIGRILRDLGFLTQKELDRQLYAYLLPKKEPSIRDLSSTLAERLQGPAFSQEASAWASRNDWVLFDESVSGLVFLATRFQDDVLEAAEEYFHKSCVLTIMSKEAIHLIRQVAGGEEASSRSMGFKARVQATDDQRIAVQAPYTSLFRDTVLAAQSLKASDIHIQPVRDGIVIRFRVNGDMLVWKELSLEHQRPFINEVKRLTNLSIAMSGRAQDGRASFKAWNLDLRASLLPSQYGEKIVLRLLDASRNFCLDALGFDEKTLRDLRDALKAKNGVILISGPTGSGKTTTLYTLLCALDRTARNIVTLEDPIEYGIEGLTQVQVSRKISFAEALRSVLRQDPDVILVGEIRDAETADLCIKAASTGHLVLSTLHANGAAEVIGRLINLGVDPFMVRSVLRFSAAQRLIQRLCPKCSIPCTGEERSQICKELLESIGSRVVISTDAKLLQRNERGCDDCRRGIIGRIPALEYMRAPQISGYLASQKSDPPHLTQTLKESCLNLVQKGEVDYREVFEME